MQLPDYTFAESRLAALASYAIVDTPSEPGFDDIVELAAQICEVPVALISFVSTDRQWFKARTGFEPQETDIDSSVCAHALIVPDLLVIPDLAHDDRTKGNPLVTAGPQIRFYAGAPIRTASGEVLGSLCVIDGKVRPGGLTEVQASGLRNLARQVTSQLELRRAIAERDALVAEQRLAEQRRTGLLHLGDQLRDMNTVGDMTRTATAIVGQVLDVTRAAFGHFDDTTEYLIVEPDWTAEGVASVAGRHRLDDYGDLRKGLLRGEALIVADATTDARTAAKFVAAAAFDVRSFVNLPIRHSNRTVAVFIVHDHQPHAWRQEELTFLRNVADRLEVGIARLQADTEQQVLNHELGHRLKNTFAMIQAIATQTLRAASDQEAVGTFIERIHALSTAHDVLLQDNWASATVRAVAESVLHALCDKSRFDILGVHMEIGARATLSLSLLLHELTTNAIKYGSLSNDGGRVAIAWRVNGADGEAVFALDWREVGGPLVEMPNKKGFGSKLIEMGIMGTREIQLRYPPTGFEAELRAPFAQMQLS